MLGSTVTLSPQYQITIPKWIRDLMDLKARQKLVTIVSDSSGTKSLTLVPKTEKTAQHSLGLGKKIWSGTDIDQYIEKQRKSWK